MLRVVRVTEDWVPFSAAGGWTQAVIQKESAVLRYYEAAIWEETDSVHLYAFPNDYDGLFGLREDVPDADVIAYREQYAISVHSDMPEMWGDRRSDFLRIAFEDFVSRLVELHPEADHHLMYSGHGGPGGALFAGQLKHDDADAFLATWTRLLGKPLGVIDMGGPCNKGAYEDLANFCRHASYYVASDLPNGGYTLDDWTSEKHDETKPETQYHRLLASNETLEKALIERVELRRKRYEYSMNNQIRDQVEQANYVYSCARFNDFSEAFELFVDVTTIQAPFYDLYQLMLDYRAPPALLDRFRDVFVHGVDNRDFFEWKVTANGMISPSTGVPSVSFATPVDSAEDRAALVELYNGTGGASWTNNTNWLSDRPIREWYGVSTDPDGRVSELFLSGNELTGEIPTELGNLSNLERLDLWENQLTGDIPTELGNLSNLERLWLYDNKLTGELPHSLTGLTALVRFTFHNNSGLCAPVDEAFQTWLQSVSTVRGSSCAPMDSAEDRATLVELYNATGGASWTNNTNWLSDRPIREWYGVGNDPDGRVSDLSLSGNELTGEIPRELGSLSNLERLTLSRNQLTGEIPRELGSLSNLERLTLSRNQLTGEIPRELGSLSNLERLWLYDNKLTGEIPTELGSLSNLQLLWLHGNQLTGEIPTELGSLSNLETLDLGGNQLTGEIPHSLTGLTALVWFTFHNNSGLCAPVDEAFQTWLQSVSTVQGSNCAPMDSAEDRAALVELYNATGGASWTNNTNWLSDRPIREWYGVSTDPDGRVSDLSLSGNELTGEIPRELGSLSNLRGLYLHDNELTGEIPTELGSLSNLEQLWLRGNQLTGDIPRELGNLSNLTWLSLWGNQLTGEIPTELGSLSNLQGLDLSYNELTGEIPPELGNLSNLTWLSLWGNQLTGDIPTELGSLSNLHDLYLSDNELAGEIPTELGSLSNLQGLDLSDNELTGEIPTELGSLSNLETLDLEGNQLTGDIPTELGSLSNLAWLLLWENQLTGEIPTELGNLSNLETLDLGGNQLTGDIPTELGNLSNLERLYLDDNELTGDIPTELGNLSNLQGLSLWGNQLTGEIPRELGNLSNLQGLSLWGNQLTGEIPTELGSLSNLDTLDLAGNQLAGDIPHSLTGLTVLVWFAFHNNSGLCAPVDEAFQTWLQSVSTVRGSSCAPMDSA